MNSPCPRPSAWRGAEPTYAGYASRINQDPEFNVLSYISSHDTKLFFGDYQDVALQRRVASSFMMLPGGIQLYYGDESGRGLAKDGGVFDQSVRSDMNWQELGERREGRAGQTLANGSASSAPPIRPLRRAATRSCPMHPTASCGEGEDKVVVVFAGRQQ